METAGAPRMLEYQTKISFRAVLWATAVLPLLGGCLSGGGSDDESSLVDPGGGTGNAAPTISGNPPGAVTAGQAYSFTPTASDSDGDTLTFSASNLPPWAQINAGNGRISGTPADGDVGMYTAVSITVSDGSASDRLGPFDIEVLAQGASTGSTTLSWTAPTQNEDGSALTNLAGYKLYWGTEPGSYPNSVTIDNPGVTTYVVENLTAGTYEFVATAFNTSGVESRFSNSATKTVQ